MATKAELESEYQLYSQALQSANQALATNEPGMAVKYAVGSLAWLAGAISFDRRYNKNEQFSFGAHDIIFRNAPPLFLSYALIAVEQQLSENKKIENGTEYCFRDLLNQSWISMRLAGRLWDNLSTLIHPDYNTPIAIAMLNYWERYGYVKVKMQKGSKSYERSVHLDENVRCKCSSCGAKSNSTKLSLLKEVRCPKCSAQTYYVILGPAPKG